MKKTLTVLVMMITGCAGGVGSHYENYDRSLSSEAQLSKDKANCNIAATQQKLEFLYKEQIYIDNCMAAKGWHQVRNQQ